MLSVQSQPDEPVGVEQVHDWVCVECERRGEDDDFVPLRDRSEEVIDSGAFLDVHCVDLALHLEGNHKVRVVDGRERRVHQRLVEI